MLRGGRFFADTV